MRALAAGALAAVVGAVLAGVTAFGVVSSVSSAPAQPDQNVMDYGTTPLED